VIHIDAPHPRNETRGDFVACGLAHPEMGCGHSPFRMQVLDNEHQCAQRALQIGGWTTITGF